MHDLEEQLMKIRGESVEDADAQAHPASGEPASPTGEVRRAVALPAMSANPGQALAPAVLPSAVAGASGNEGGGERRTRPDTGTGRSASGALTAGATGADAALGSGSAREVTETGAVARKEAKPERASSASGQAAPTTTTAGARLASDAEDQESGVVAAVGSMPPGGGDEDDGENSEKPKKPFLAAAAIAGVVLAAIPLLIFVTGRSDDSAKKNTASSAAEVKMPFEESGTDAPLDVYVAAKPGNEKSTPTPTPNKSASSQPRKSPDAGAETMPTATATSRPTKAKPRSGVQKIAQAPVGSSGSVVTYHLVSAQTGKCLSADHASDGAWLFIWDCDGSREQNWTFKNDGTIQLKGLCMEVSHASRDEGAVVQLSRCSGNAAQQFRLNSNHELFAVNSGNCVDVRKFGEDNGTPVQTWGCSRRANQSWSRR
ncbi:ricin-type beta-trefoil lectin domain protein [Streptomyces sp. NBC_01320]|uniref:ricin-type beta-trefoil lectin domain protein n=1 Tax=Streptomyces sp. NBC_01320 TaxID=2903824 RepID=UPI002E1666E7|nr:ricin-type beta-trefoil lectin domain protein [Streptomyces sp. NBC_01320]